MNKFNLLLLFILNFLIFSCGSNNGNKKSDFSLKIAENKSEFTENRDEIFDKLHKQGEDVTFILSFTKNKSFFEIASKLENDISPLGKSWADNIVAKGRYYTDLKENAIYRQTDTYGEKILIKSPIASGDWKLTNESKFIGKYKTFKAIKKETVENSVGTFDFEIVAWYCPQLPGQFGPKEFNSLPGLILELKDTHFTFHATEIEKMKDGNVDIKPLIGRVLTEKEYSDKIKGITPGFFSPQNRQ